MKHADCWVSQEVYIKRQHQMSPIYMIHLRLQNTVVWLFTLR